jgi:hypothetical protein
VPNEGNREKTVDFVNELLVVAVSASVGEDVCAVCNG